MARLRSPSAAPPPGTAGVVSRGLSAVIDAAVVLGLAVGAYAVQATAVFLVDPRGFVPPDTTLGWFLDAWILLAIGYLALSWAVLGGTRGDKVMGLRVLTAGGTPPGLLHSTARAILCVLFPLGLLWVAVSRRQRSVQDLVLRTHVVHDWRQPRRTELFTHES